MYKHWEWMSGVSFLPFTAHTYRQAPYQDIDKKQYEQLMATMPTDVNWDALTEYESSDMTEGAQELACSAGGCEIV